MSNFATRTYVGGPSGQIFANSTTPSSIYGFNPKPGSSNSRIIYNSQYWRVLQVFPKDNKEYYFRYLKNVDGDFKQVKSLKEVRAFWTSPAVAANPPRAISKSSIDRYVASIDKDLATPRKQVDMPGYTYPVGWDGRRGATQILKKNGEYYRMVWWTSKTQYRDPIKITKDQAATLARRSNVKDISKDQELLRASEGLASSSDTVRQLGIQPENIVKLRTKQGNVYQSEGNDTEYLYYKASDGKEYLARLTNAKDRFSKTGENAFTKGPGGFDQLIPIKTRTDGKPFVVMPKTNKNGETNNIVHYLTSVTNSGVGAASFSTGFGDVKPFDDSDNNYIGRYKRRSINSNLKGVDLDWIPRVSDKDKYNSYQVEKDFAANTRIVMTSTEGLRAGKPFAIAIVDRKNNKLTDQQLIDIRDNRALKDDEKAVINAYLANDARNQPFVKMPQITNWDNQSVTNMTKEEYITFLKSPESNQTIYFQNDDVIVTKDKRDGTYRRYGPTGTVKATQQDLMKARDSLYKLYDEQTLFNKLEDEKAAGEMLSIIGGIKKINKSTRDQVLRYTGSVDYQDSHPGQIYVDGNAIVIKNDDGKVDYLKRGAGGSFQKMDAYEKDQLLKQKNFHDFIDKSNTDQAIKASYFQSRNQVDDLLVDEAIQKLQDKYPSDFIKAESQKGLDYIRSQNKGIATRGSFDDYLAANSGEIDDRFKAYEMGRPDQTTYDELTKQLQESYFVHQKNTLTKDVIDRVYQRMPYKFGESKEARNKRFVQTFDDLMRKALLEEDNPDYDEKYTKANDAIRNMLKQNESLQKTDRFTWEMSKIKKYTNVDPASPTSTFYLVNENGTSYLYDPATNKKILAEDYEPGLKADPGDTLGEVAKAFDWSKNQTTPTDTSKTITQTLTHTFGLDGKTFTLVRGSDGKLYGVNQEKGILLKEEDIPDDYKTRPGIPIANTKLNEKDVMAYNTPMSQMFYINKVQKLTSDGQYFYSKLDKKDVKFPIDEALSLKSVGDGQIYRQYNKKTNEWRYVNLEDIPKNIREYMGMFDDNQYLATLGEDKRSQLTHHQYYFDKNVSLGNQLPLDVTFLHIDYENGVVAWVDQKTRSSHMSYILPPQDRPKSNKDLSNHERQMLHDEALENMRKGLKSNTLQELSFIDQYKYMQKHEYLRDRKDYTYIEDEIKYWGSQQAIRNEGTVRKLMKDKKDFSEINAIVLSAPPGSTNADLLRYVERYYISKNKNQVVQQMPDGKYIVDYKSLDAPYVAAAEKARINGLPLTEAQKQEFIRQMDRSHLAEEAGEDDQTISDEAIKRIADRIDRSTSAGDKNQVFGSQQALLDYYKKQYSGDISDDVLAHTSGLVYEDGITKEEADSNMRGIRDQLYAYEKMVRDADSGHILTADQIRDHAMHMFINKGTDSHAKAIVDVHRSADNVPTRYVNDQINAVFKNANPIQSEVNYAPTDAMDTAAVRAELARDEKAQLIHDSTMPTEIKMDKMEDVKISHRPEIDRRIKFSWYIDKQSFKYYNKGYSGISEYVEGSLFHNKKIFTKYLQEDRDRSYFEWSTLTESHDGRDSEEGLIMPPYTQSGMDYDLSRLEHSSVQRIHNRRKLQSTSGSFLGTICLAVLHLLGIGKTTPGNKPIADLDRTIEIEQIATNLFSSDGLPVTRHRLMFWLFISMFAIQFMVAGRLPGVHANNVATLITYMLKKINNLKHLQVEGIIASRTIVVNTFNLKNEIDESFVTNMMDRLRRFRVDKSGRLLRYMDMFGQVARREIREKYKNWADFLNSDESVDDFLIQMVRNRKQTISDAKDTIKLIYPHYDLNTVTDDPMGWVGYFLQTPLASKDGEFVDDDNWGRLFKEKPRNRISLPDEGNVVDEYKWNEDMNRYEYTKRSDRSYGLQAKIKGRIHNLDDPDWHEKIFDEKIKTHYPNVNQEDVDTLRHVIHNRDSEMAANKAKKHLDINYKPIELSFGERGAFLHLADFAYQLHDHHKGDVEIFNHKLVSVKNEKLQTSLEEIVQAFNLRTNKMITYMNKNGFMIVDGDKAVVGFRGSDGAGEVVGHLNPSLDDFAGVNKIKKSFKTKYYEGDFHEEIKKNTQIKNIYIGGHSAGGALSAMFALWLYQNYGDNKKIKILNYATPPLFDLNTQQRFDKIMNITGNSYQNLYSTGDTLQAGSHLNKLAASAGLSPFVHPSKINNYNVESGVKGPIIDSYNTPFEYPSLFSLESWYNTKHGIDSYKRAIEGKVASDEVEIIRDPWPVIMANVFKLSKGGEATFNLATDSYFYDISKWLSDNIFPEGSLRRFGNTVLNSISYVANVFLSIAVSHIVPKATMWAVRNMMSFINSVRYRTSRHYHPMAPTNLHHMIPFHGGKFNMEQLATTMAGFNPISMGIFRTTVEESVRNFEKANHLDVLNTQLDVYNQELQHRIALKDQSIALAREALNAESVENVAARTTLQNRILKEQLEIQRLESKMLKERFNNSRDLKKIIKKINQENDRTIVNKIKEYEKSIVSKRTSGEAIEYFSRVRLEAIKARESNPLQTDYYRSRERAAEQILDLFAAKNANIKNTPLGTLIRFVIDKSESLVDVLGLALGDRAGQSSLDRVPGRSSRITDRRIEGWFGRLSSPFVVQIKQHLNIKKIKKRNYGPMMNPIRNIKNEMALAAQKILIEYIKLKARVITRPPMAP